MPFDPNDYVKRVLAPAVQAFQKERRLPDLFERFDLPLTISDAKEIEARIDAVKDLWNKRALTVSRDRPLLETLRTDLPNSRRVLLDPAARKAERAVIEAERNKRKEAQYAGLDSVLRLVASKGYLTPDEEKAIIARFSPALSEKEIRSRIKVEIRAEAAVLPTSEGLPSSHRNQIKNSLAVLGKRDLYDFLSLPPSAGRPEISRRHKEMETECWTWRIDFTKTATEELLGHVKSLLIDGDPAKYAAAQLWERVEQLRAEVELAAIDKRITREESQQLRRRALEIGLTEKEADAYIPALAQQAGAAIEVVAGGDTVACPNCSALRPKEEPRCTLCGADLWLSCPRCSTKVPRSLGRCGSCQLGFDDLPKVDALLRRGQLAVADGDLGAAVQTVTEVEVLWSGHPEAAKLKGKIEQARTRLEQLRKDVDLRVSQRELAAARELARTLSGLSRGHSFADGRTAAQLLAEVEGELQKASRLVTSAQEHERQRRVREAVLDYERALSVAHDLPEARDGLLRHPPEPCGAVRAASTAGSVLVQWDPSPAAGRLSYRVVRRAGRAPTSPSDGDPAGETFGNSLRDDHAPPGVVTYYTVFTCRGGAFSQGRAGPAVLVAREVDGFSLEVSDGAVIGEWKLASAGGRVRVWRKAGGAPAAGEGVEVPVSGRESFVDRGVQNGSAYYYRVLVEYQDESGQPVRTPGVVASVQPEAPPLPVMDLLLEPGDGALLLRWSPPPRGTVTVYRMNERPSFANGSKLSRGALQALGTSLKAAGASSAVDPNPPSGVAYYLPVTASGDAAVAGTARQFVAVAEVTGVTAEDFSRYLLLRWTWPADCNLALVAWRADRHATGPTDPHAQTQLLSRSDYERHGGFRLENPERQPYWFSVHAGAEAGPERLFSAGLTSDCRAVLRNEFVVDIAYDLSRWPWPWKKATLTLRAEQPIAHLPAMVVVAKAGDLQPLRPSDGVVLREFTGISLKPQSEVVVELSLSGLRTPACVRALFVNPEEHRRFRLVEPPPSRLKLR